MTPTSPHVGHGGVERPPRRCAGARKRAARVFPPGHCTIRVGRPKQGAVVLVSAAAHVSGVDPSARNAGQIPARRAHGTAGAPLRFSGGFASRLSQQEADLTAALTGQRHGGFLHTSEFYFCFFTHLNQSTVAKRPQSLPLFHRSTWPLPLCPLLCRRCFS